MWEDVDDSAKITLIQKEKIKEERILQTVTAGSFTLEYRIDPAIPTPKSASY